MLAGCGLAWVLFGAGCSERSADGGDDNASKAPPARAEAAQAVTAQSTERLPVVLEVFGVGKQVYVRSLALDKAANSLWVGTSVGVHEIDLADRGIKHTFTRKDGLANEYVFAIFVDRHGYKWFGTNAGGATRYKDGDWKTYFPMHGLADYWVYSFASQADGTLWIGTWAGANRVDPVSGKFTTYVKELVNEWVYGLAVDSHDRVWFGTEGGISRFDGQRWQSWTHDDGLGAPNPDGRPASRNTGLGTRSRHDLGVMSGGQATYNPNYVFSLAITEGDVVWAGTWGGGVSRFDGKQWRNYTMRDGLAGDIVYAVMQASDGAMWFGTNRGISRFDGEHWQNFNLHHGLPDLNIYTLAETPNGDVWAGTRGAVVRIGLKAQ
ncbi:MAG TPA: regulator [Gammaproteobacteria bacterium]|nr:regulator [Gammaproteobacteria bacterium]